MELQQFAYSWLEQFARQFISAVTMATAATDFVVHNVWLGAGKWAVECVANLGRVPRRCNGVRWRAEAGNGLWRADARSCTVGVSYGLGGSAAGVASALGFDFSPTVLTAITR